MIVDLEQDEELEEDLLGEYGLDEIFEAKTDSILARHWEVHKPKKAERSRGRSTSTRGVEGNVRTF
jgi:hypothetical protein